MESITVFKNKFKSYIIILALGIFAGLLVAFFSGFANDTLWSFSSFSSMTFGFWIFTTSLIVLLSEKRIVSAVNASLYIYVMFFMTGIYKSFRSFYSEYNFRYESIGEVISGEILGWMKYGAVPALCCAGLALLLWQGRMKSLSGKIILATPIFAILIEALNLYYTVLFQHKNLFMALIDSLCVLLYIIIFKKHLFAK